MAPKQFFTFVCCEIIFFEKQNLRQSWRQWNNYLISWDLIFLFLTINCDHFLAPFFLTLFVKRGIFTRSALMWVFCPLSFSYYHVVSIDGKIGRAVMYYNSKIWNLPTLRNYLKKITLSLSKCIKIVRKIQGPKHLKWKVTRNI